MYQEDNKTNYLKIALRILLFILIFLLAYKLLSMFINNRKKYLDNNNMDHNLNSMQDVALKYFKEGTDIKVGENKKVYLNELIDNGLINELKDEYKYVCSKEESYIELYRLENEYRIKSYLVCNNKKNDKYTYVDSLTKEEKTTEPTTTTTTVAKTTTTKKTTTKHTTDTITITTTEPSNETYTVSFNTNGGVWINPIKVKKGDTLTLPTPKKKGYTFYQWIDSEGNSYANSITPTNNIVLIAKWR